MEYKSNKKERMITRLEDLMEIMGVLVPSQLCEKYCEAIQYSIIELETYTTELLEGDEDEQLDRALTWIAEHSESVDQYIRALKWIGLSKEEIEKERELVESK